MQDGLTMATTKVGPRTHSNPSNSYQIAEMVLVKTAIVRTHQDVSGRKAYNNYYGKIWAVRVSSRERKKKRGKGERERGERE